MNSQRISAKILFSLLLLTFLMLPGCRLTIYSISGKVSGDVSAGVTITIALSGFGSAKTTTDANGNYTFRFLANGNYTVTPSCAGYTFTPVNSTVTVKGKSITNVNFVSTRFGYTVSFDSQGATIEANPTTIKVIPPATTVGTLPEPPTRTGYIFAGWYTAPNGGGTAFTADTPVTADLTVYAKWELLICIRLNSSTSEEEFGVINTSTGDFTVKGTVGDLKSWVGKSAIAGNTLYVIGFNSSDEQKLYILDTSTGSLISSVKLSSDSQLILSSIDNNGNLIGIRLNSSTSEEEFGVINTSTGDFTVKGTVGDLKSWVGKSAIAGNTLYVIGYNSSSEQKLYILNTSTGSLISSVKLSSDSQLVLSSIDNNGNLIGIRLNSSTSEEEFGVIDASTGDFTVKGIVGDLKSWVGQSTVNGNVLYVIGFNSSSEQKLYILNTGTGSLISSVKLSLTASELVLSGLADI